MKKLILASAIAAIAANSATAATIYDDKGLTFKMKGDWQIQLRDNDAADEELDVEYDDLEIKNSVVYDLGNDMKAFGQLDFGFDGDDDDASLEEAYIGLQIHNVKVSVGRQDLASDDFGIVESIESVLEDDAFDADADIDSGNDVIRVEAAFDAVEVIFTHDLDAEGTDTDNGSATDLYVGGEFGPVALGAAYQTADEGGDNVDTWGVSAAFDAGIATIGADYSSSNRDDIDVINLVASFKAAETTTVAVGYVRLDEDGEDALDGWYANASYKFPSQKNVKLFAQIGDADGYDEADVFAGMQIKF